MKKLYVVYGMYKRQDGIARVFKSEEYNIAKEEFDRLIMTKKFEYIDFMEDDGKKFKMIENYYDKKEQMSC